MTVMGEQTTPGATHTVQEMLSRYVEGPIVSVCTVVVHTKVS